MSVAYDKRSVLQKLIDSGHAYSRKEAFEAGRNACVEYARKAYAHRGDPILLLLADDLAEIEAPKSGAAAPDHARDLELLAKLRGDPCFVTLLSELEGINDVRDCSAGEKLLQLLKGTP